MTSRYASRVIRTNADPLYRESLKKRSRRLIQQYVTPVLEYPTVADMEELVIANHVWSLGDRYYKLAHKHYGDPELWWVIAWYNNSPTESHLKLGDVIFIPSPLERLFHYYGV